MAAIDRASIRAMHYAPSASALEIACAGLIHDNDRRQSVTRIARDFVINSRQRSDESGTLDPSLRHSGLSTHEGIATVCRAPTLLCATYDAT